METEVNIKDVINSIICGDCRDRMKQIPDESVDLIYLDPPFFSSNGYNLIWGKKDSKATIKAFEDASLYKKVCGKCGRSWRINPKTGKYYATCRDGCNGMLKDTTSSPMNTPEIFTEWLRGAIKECYRVLTPTGSIYCHLDWHAVHYIKVMMDEIFGYDNFRNEIVWHYKSVSNVKNDFARKHDTILRYVKGKEYTFNMDVVREPYDEKTVKRYKTSVKFPNGYEAKMNEKGKAPDDVWVIPPIRNVSKERMGYQTQKPEALLERILLASSNKGDIVLDPFCGCGTTIAVAQRLGRCWIGIDIEPLSCTVIQTRMYNTFGVSVPLIDLEKTLTEDEAIDIVQQSHKMDPFEFQNWIVMVLGGRPNPKRSGDGGIDGWIKKPFGVLTDGDPIQVKMSAKVGDPVVKLFAFNTMNEGRDHGVIVAYSFSSTAESTAKNIYEQHGIDIWLMTVRDMLIMTSKKTVKTASKQTRGIQGKIC